jgi:hypothetical protein
MGIKDRLNSTFDNVGSFAAAAGAGVQEDISPLRNEIAGLRGEVSRLRAEIGTLQSQVAAAAAAGAATGTSVEGGVPENTFTQT